jgi:energy-coupling factor transport system permease protein
MLPFTFFMHALLASDGMAFFRLLFQGIFQPVFLSDAFHFTLRILVFIYMMGGLFVLIHMQRLLDAAAQVLMPLGKFGVPVNSLFQILNIGLRFFPVLKQESNRLQEVRQSLGVGGEQTIPGRIKAQMNNLVPIFINTMHRAETVAQMMSLRGFDPAEKRTLYATVSWRIRDSLLLAVCLLTSRAFLLV